MRTAVLISALLVASVAAVPDKLICYFESWAGYRQDLARYDVEDIDTSLCTHYIYSFVGLNSDGTMRIQDSWNDIDKAAYTRFTSLKQSNPDKIFYIAIGGWNEGSEVFSNVYADPDLRNTFVQSAADFLEQYGFEGLDFDWEYPNQRGGKEEDVANFVEVLRLTREEFDRRGRGWLITAAVGVSEETTTLSYDVNGILQYLDWANLMTYDYHGSWDTTTGHVAPLYGNDVDPNPGFNVDYCVNFWLNQGAAPEKLVLGIPTYGRTFALADANDNGVGATAWGGGDGGPYTNTWGFLAYYEVCSQDWTYAWDAQSQAVYAYRGNQWVTFDNVDTTTYKAQYAAEKNLGGVMIWSLDDDDFHGTCGSVHPIINAARNGLGW